MKFQSYRDARDASWHFLINNSISELPVNIAPILKSFKYNSQKGCEHEIFPKGTRIFGLRGKWI